MQTCPTIKNAEISRRILFALQANGGDLVAAIDSVLGAGTYAQVACDLWEAARAK